MEARHKVQDISSAMLIRNCRLSEEDCEALQRLHDAKLVRGKTLKTYREKAVFCPAPLDDAAWQGLLRVGSSTLITPPSLCVTVVHSQV
eukprot:6251855-Amphidinium_carterae.3